MQIELYHYTLTYKDKRDSVIRSMIGAIRATSRTHSLERLNDKVPNLRLGIYEVIAFTSKTANQLALDNVVDDLIAT